MFVYLEPFECSSFCTSSRAVVRTFGFLNV